MTKRFRSGKFYDLVCLAGSIFQLLPLCQFFILRVTKVDLKKGGGSHILVDECFNYEFGNNSFIEPIVFHSIVMDFAFVGWSFETITASQNS